VSINYTELIRNLELKKAKLLSEKPQLLDMQYKIDCMLAEIGDDPAARITALNVLIQESVNKTAQKLQELKESLGLIEDFVSKEGNKNPIDP